MLRRARSKRSIAPSGNNNVTCSHEPQALLRAADTASPYNRVLASTVGVVFLATPFFGTGMARVFEWQVLGNKIRGEQASARLMDDLDLNADFVHQRAQKFAELANAESVRLSITCYFETKKTETLRFFLSPGVVKYFTNEHTHEIVRAILPVLITLLT